MIEVITQLINAFLHFYIVYFFLSIFFKLKYKSLFTNVTYIVITIIFSLALINLDNSILRFFCVYGLTFLFSFLFKSKVFSKFVYVSIIYALNSIIEVLTVLIMQISFDARFNFSDYNSTFIIGMLVSKFITLILLILLKLKRHNSLSDYMSKKHWNLLLFPLSTLLFSILITTIFIQSPNQNSLILFLTLTAFSILIAANMIIFDYIDSISENIKSKNKIKFAKEIINSQTKQYKELINYNKEIIKIKHDHKNFCIGVITALREGKIDTAINKITKEYDLCTDDHLFHDSVIHTIVEIKKKSIQNSNIEINFDSQPLNKLNISSIDVAIILGNALDNAIEACEKIKGSEIKLINITIDTKHKNTFIVVDNPVNEEIDLTNLNSTKSHNTNHHGIGIVSMKQIANKYDGEVILECKDMRFIATIMLKNISQNNANVHYF